MNKLLIPIILICVLLLIQPTVQAASVWDWITGLFPITGQLTNVRPGQTCQYDSDCITGLDCGPSDEGFVGICCSSGETCCNDNNPCPSGYACENHDFGQYTGSDRYCVSSCTPSCSGKECGDDSCGGSCGSCSSSKECSSGTCVEKASSVTQLTFGEKWTSYRLSSANPQYVKFSFSIEIPSGVNNVLIDTLNSNCRRPKIITCGDSECEVSVSPGQTLEFEASCTETYITGDWGFLHVKVDKIKNDNGERCYLDDECKSSNCENNECCASGKTCCSSNTHCYSLGDRYNCDSSLHYCKEPTCTDECDSGSDGCLDSSRIWRCSKGSDYCYDKEYYSTCISGYECKSGECVKKAVTTKYNGQSCTSNSQCQSSYCSNGYCCSSGNCCSSDTNCQKYTCSNCGSGYKKCSSYKCIDCTREADCKTGYYCKSGVCTKGASTCTNECSSLTAKGCSTSTKKWSCEKGSDDCYDKKYTTCISGYECKSGECVKTSTKKAYYETCSSDSECDSNSCFKTETWMSTGICCPVAIACCTTNTHCGYGFKCSSNKCVESSKKSDGESCSSDSECISYNCDNGYCCSSGTCCTRDTHCSSLGTGYVCKYNKCTLSAKKEAGEDCTKTTECKSGLYCSNKICCKSLKVCCNENNEADVCGKYDICGDDNYCIDKPEPEKCGNGKCDLEEDCDSCAKDCTCQSNACCAPNSKNANKGGKDSGCVSNYLPIDSKNYCCDGRKKDTGGKPCGYKPSCTSNSNCKDKKCDVCVAGQRICRDDKCVECTKDNDCTSKYFCFKNLCSSKAKAGGYCTSDNGCLSGRCQNQKCLTKCGDETCDSDETCKTCPKDCIKSANSCCEDLGHGFKVYAHDDGDLRNKEGETVYCCNKKIQKAPCGAPPTPTGELITALHGNANYLKNSIYEYPITDVKLTVHVENSLIGNVKGIAKVYDGTEPLTEAKPFWIQQGVEQDIFLTFRGKEGDSYDDVYASIKYGLKGEGLKLNKKTSSIKIKIPDTDKKQFEKLDLADLVKKQIVGNTGVYKTEVIVLNRIFSKLGPVKTALGLVGNILDNSLPFTLMNLILENVYGRLYLVAGRTGESAPALLLDQYKSFARENVKEGDIIEVVLDTEFLGKRLNPGTFLIGASNAEEYINLGYSMVYVDKLTSEPFDKIKDITEGKAGIERNGFGFIMARRVLEDESLAAYLISDMDTEMWALWSDGNPPTLKKHSLVKFKGKQALIGLEGQKLGIGTTYFVLEKFEPIGDQKTEPFTDSEKIAKDHKVEIGFGNLKYLSKDFDSKRPALFSEKDCKTYWGMFDDLLVLYTSSMLEDGAKAMAKSWEWSTDYSCNGEFKQRGYGMSDCFWASSPLRRTSYPNDDRVEAKLSTETTDSERKDKTIIYITADSTDRLFMDMSDKIYCRFGSGGVYTKDGNKGPYDGCLNIVKSPYNQNRYMIVILVKDESVFYSKGNTLLANYLMPVGSCTQFKKTLKLNQDFYLYKNGEIE